MNNVTKLQIYEVLLFPVAALGWLVYMLIETPFLQGRVKAFSVLTGVAEAADKEEEGSE